MAVDESGLMSLLHDWWGLAAAAAAAISGWAVRGKDLENRISHLETASDENKERFRLMERLVHDTQLSVTKIEVAIKPMEDVPAILSDLRALVGKLQGRIEK
jgi:hypothetical protein